jgi:atypical dual specificity phosphatase
MPVYAGGGDAFMVYNFAFVYEDKLAGCAHPGSGGSLRESLQVLTQEYGITAILCLTEAPLDQALLAEYKLAFFHLPIEDFSVPPFDATDDAVDFVLHELDRNGRVAVHCGAGYGRTGTLLACCLVALGRSPQEAITQVRQQRPGSIENALQESYIWKWTQCWSKKTGHATQDVQEGEE